jgi:hypothetical protein
MKNESSLILGDSPVAENLWRTVLRDPRVRAVLTLALIIRLAIVGYLAVYPGGIFAKGDSRDYLQLAQNLYYYHAFAQADRRPEMIRKLVVPQGVEGKKVALAPEIYRTPGYPLFLAFFYSLSANPLLAVAAQSLLSLLAVWLTVLLMARLFRPESAWMAGLLAAIEPLSLIYSHELMSDSLFTLLILATVFLFFRLLDGGPRPLVAAILGGLFLGLAMLTRPVGVYFPGLLILWWAVTRWLQGRPPAAAPPVLPRSPQPRVLAAGRAPLQHRYLAIFMGVMLVTSSAWVVRNYRLFHRPIISTSADHNVLIQITSMVEATLRSSGGGLPYWQLRHELEKELTAKMIREGRNGASEAERAAYFRDWSLGVLKAHPGLTLRYLVEGAFTLFLTDVPSFYELLGFSREARNAWGLVFQKGLRPALAMYFGKNWALWVWGVAPLILYDLLVYILACRGIIALCRGRQFYLLFLLLTIIGYWVAISAMGGLPRYRLPLMPYLIFLAAWGLFNLPVWSPVGGQNLADAQA